LPLDKLERASSGSTISPITRIARCCSRAVSGHAAASPSSLTNSRLFIRSPHRRGRVAWTALRGQTPWGPKIDDKLELRRRLHRQIGGLLSVENAIYMRRGLPPSRQRPMPHINLVSKSIWFAGGRTEFGSRW